MTNRIDLPFKKRPLNQVVYNTLNTQYLNFEKQNIPMRQYHSRTINLNLKSIVDNPYYKYVPNNLLDPVNGDNLVTIVDSFLTYDNCLLGGFEVGVDKIEGSVITFKIYPGIAIMDHYIIELFEFAIFDFDTSIDLNSDIIIVALDYEGQGIGEYTINFYLLDNNFNTVQDNWKHNLLPLTIFKITERDNDLSVLSLESLGVPFLIEDVEPPRIFKAELSLLLQFAEIEYIELIKNKMVLGVNSLTPLYIPPEKYIINGIPYLIPNYGKHVNNGYDLIKNLLY